MDFQTDAGNTTKGTEVPLRFRRLRFSDTNRHAHTSLGNRLYDNIFRRRLSSRDAKRRASPRLLQMADIGKCLRMERWRILSACSGGTARGTPPSAGMFLQDKAAGPLQAVRLKISA